MDQIPVQLAQLLTLAFSTVMVTQVLKSIASSIGGKGSIVVSAVVSILLTLIAYVVAWVPVTAPVCDPAVPIACARDWMAVAIAVVTLANVLYVLVYQKVFGTPEPEPVIVTNIGKL